MEQSKINRINELYAKSKSEGLSQEELSEQAKLRKEYIDSYKRSLTTQLDNTYVLDDKGNKTKISRKGKSNGQK